MEKKRVKRDIFCINVFMYLKATTCSKKNSH